MRALPRIALALAALTLPVTGVVASPAYAVNTPAAITVPMKHSIVTVTWQLTPTVKVTGGNLATLPGHKALFTISAKSASQVTPAMIASAKALASKYKGTYSGVTVSSTAAKPTLTAKYLV